MGHVLLFPISSTMSRSLEASGTLIQVEKIGFLRHFDIIGGCFEYLWFYLRFTSMILYPILKPFPPLFLVSTEKLNRPIKEENLTVSFFRTYYTCYCHRKLYKGWGRVKGRKIGKGRRRNWKSKVSNVGHKEEDKEGRKVVIHHPQRRLRIETIIWRTHHWGK